MRRIAIDLDGVLVEFNRAAWEWLEDNGWHPTPLPPGGPLAWDWFPTVVSSAGENAFWDHVHRTPAWWGALPCHRDFTSSVRGALSDLCQKEQVFFVTARPCGRKEAEEWLQFYLSGVRPIVFLSSGSKATFLSALDVDVVVDDRFETLWSLGGNPSIRCILVDRPWNRERPSLDCIERVPSTGAALEALGYGNTESGRRAASTGTQPWPTPISSPVCAGADRHGGVEREEAA